MAVQIGISRRRALEMTIAMGGLAMAGGAGHAQTPPTPKIEQLAPELEKIISTSEPIQHLADGFGGTRARPKGRCGGRKANTCCSATSTTTSG